MITIEIVSTVTDLKKLQRLWYWLLGGQTFSSAICRRWANIQCRKNIFSEKWVVA